MPNKHFCQGPTCHEHVTQDRFLKSRGVIRGRYAYLKMDYQNHPESYYDNRRNKYFVAKVVKVNGYQLTWKTLNMVDR